MIRNELLHIKNKSKVIVGGESPGFSNGFLVELEIITESIIDLGDAGAAFTRLIESRGLRQKIGEIGSVGTVVVVLQGGIDERERLLPVQIEFGYDLIQFLGAPLLHELVPLDVRFGCVADPVDVGHNQRQFAA